MTFLEACWHWLSQSNNQKFLALVGAVVAAVLWQVYLHFSKKPKDTPTISASTGGIAAGVLRDLSQVMGSGLAPQPRIESTAPSMLTALIDSVEQKMAQLDRARTLSAAALAQLQKHYDIELTDDLTYERGITVGGKMLRNPLGAVDHYETVQWMRELATLTAPIGESTVCELHRRIGARGRLLMAGKYRPRPLQIGGFDLPRPAEIPHLMEEFGAWLKAAPPDPAFAFEAHFRLTAIHPFMDGNGRTARLLMNLLLICGGYPPVDVRPGGRYTYTSALACGALDGDMRPFQIFMHERLNATMREYLTALQEARGENPACPR